MLRILCFGDSITLGEKDYLNGGWVDRLKSFYLEKCQNAPAQQVSVYNLGIGGETTDGLARRFEVEFNARRIKGQKIRVIFAYGSNDIVIHKSKNIVPEAYFVRNLKNCVQHAVDKNAEVILTSLLPISDETDGSINQYDQLRRGLDIDSYNSILKKLAAEMQCQYLDIYSSFGNKNDLLASDGLHPNSDGHKLIYELVLSHFEQ